MDNSKYDKDTEDILLAYGADAVCVIVVGGRFGNGACTKVSAPGNDPSRALVALRMETLAKLLRKDAERIRNGEATWRPR
jgi:hypothetical protein